MSNHLLLWVIGPVSLWAQAILPDRLPVAYTGKPYSAGPLMTTGGGSCVRNAVSFTIAEGRLPDGLQLSSAGYLQGVAIRVGAYPILVQASNACYSWSQPYTIDVLEPPRLQTDLDTLVFEIPPAGPKPTSRRILLTSEHAALPYTLEAPPFPWLSVRGVSGTTGPKGDWVEFTVDPSWAFPGRWSATVWLTAWQVTAPASVRVILSVPRPPLHSEQSPLPTRLGPLPQPPEIHLPPAPARVETLPEPVAPPAPPVATTPLPHFGFRRWRGRPASAAPKPSPPKPSPLGKPAEPPIIQPRPAAPYVPSPRTVKAEGHSK